MAGTYHREERDGSPLALLQRHLWLFATVGCLVSFIDALAGGQSGFNIGLALGLGFGAATLLGLIWSVGHLALLKAPRAVSITVWMVAGLAMGLLLADELNAFVRLQGPHRTLAIITLIGTTVGGLGLGYVSAYVQPGPIPEDGWRAKLRGPLRFAIAVPLAAIAVALIIIERSVMVGLYPAAHTAMWVLGIWGITSAITIALNEIQIPLWLTRPGWLIGLALTLNGFIYLQSNADEAIHQLRQSPTVAFSMNTLRSTSDLDGDGFSSLLGGGDCDAFNAKVNPAAKEIPGNGLDDNCMLGDAPDVNEIQDSVTTSDEVVGTSVVLITVDTLRPDHLSLYGYARPTTPHLNRFAAESMVFDRAYSASAWTSLAISAMMRGLYPRRIEWTKVYETNKFHLVREEEKNTLAPGEKLRLMFTMPLEDPRKPLARQLQERGMYTAAVVDDGYAEFLSEKMGVNAGFDRFMTMDSLPKKSRTDKGTVNLAMKVLRDIPKNQEFFLWVHLFGPHDPNSRHRGVKQFGKSLVDKYDHEIVYADKQLGRLLRRLKWMGKQRKIAIAITSDHGEQFFKHRRYHGIDLAESNIRVPLIVSHPDWPAGRTDTLASLVDIAPTILAWTGTSPSHRQDGEDLSHYVLGYKPYEGRQHIAETWYVSQAGVAKRDLVAVFDGQHKVVHNRLRNYSKVVSQTDLTRPVKNLGRKYKPAQPLIQTLNRYLEETSGPIWKN